MIPANENDRDPQVRFEQSEIDPRLERIIDHFVERLRCGEQPSVDEYMDQYPDLSSEIKHLFPALVAMEGVGSCAEAKEPATPESQPTPNHIGPYTIVREIGRGGMGVVYLARQPDLDRLVALKILPSHFQNNPTLLERFKREAITSAQMNHEHIVQVYDVGTTSSAGVRIHYFTMQYIDGESLDEFVRRKTSLSRPGTQNRVSTDLNNEITELDLKQTEVRLKEPDTDSKTNTQQPLRAPKPGHDFWSRLAKIGIETADALAHTHSQEILHRDIKPSNLLFDKNGKTWVTDFGLAKLQNTDETPTDGVVGTLRFMAPERFRGWADPRSDVYSLGMTLYELVTLQPGFQEDDRGLLISKIINESVRKPRSIDPSIPSDLETIVLKAIEKEPADRYPSALSLRDDLQRFVELKPILAKRTSSFVKSKQWCRRNPIQAGLGITVVVLLVALTIGSMAAAFQFNDLATELQKEKAVATRQLLLAYQSEAQSRLASKRPGHRVETMQAIDNALSILPNVESTNADLLRLRNASVAAQALVDIQRVKEVDFRTRTGVDFSPFLDHFVYVDPSHVLRVCKWNGEEIWNRQFPEIQGPFVIFSPKQTYVALLNRSKYNAIIFELATGNVVFERENTRMLRFNREETEFAVTNGRGETAHLSIYDLGDLASPPKVVETEIQLGSVFYIPGGRYLISYHWDRNRGSNILYDRQTGEAKLVKTVPYQVNLHPSPDGKYLAVGCSNGLAYVLSFPDMKTIWKLPNHFNEVRYIDISHDGKLLLTASWGGSTHMWNLETGKLVMNFWSRYFRFCRRDHRLAFHQAGKLVLHDVIVPENFYAVHDSRAYMISKVDKETGLFATSHADGIRLRDRRMQTRIPVNDAYTYHANIVRRDSINFSDSLPIRLNSVEGRDVDVVSSESYVTLSPDQKSVAWHHASGKLRIAPANNLENAVEISTVSRVHRRSSNFSFSADSRYLAFCDDHIQIVNAIDGQLVHKFDARHSGDPRWAPVFRPDGKQLIYNQHQNYVVFDLETFELIREIPSNGTFGGAAWTSDCKILAITKRQGEIQLLDSQDFSELAILQTPRSTGINQIMIDDEDGLNIYALGHTHDIFHWDVTGIRRILAQQKLDW